MNDGKARIFILEDEALIAFEMTEILEDLGFEVVGPSVHLEDGKEIARCEEFDVAFLDVNLGEGKTSRPIADILRERKIPFVFITAYSPEQITFRTSEDRIMSKPITGDSLLETLRDILPDLEDRSR